ncbi:MAG: primosomal protein N', partial [Pirellulaceae bacterium]
TGRGDRPGRVLVQTVSPEHPAIAFACHHDYQGFMGQELATREKFGYPPYGSLARIIVRGPELMATERFAEQLGKQITKLRSLLGVDQVRLLGPAAPPIARLRGNHRFHLLLLAEEPGQLHRLLARLQSELKPPKEVLY